VTVTVRPVLTAFIVTPDPASSTRRPAPTVPVSVVGTETLGTVWLGLTVGCARCHTHKYDQITQTEYYQLLSYFNNGDEVNKQVPTSPAEWAVYEKNNGDAVKKLIPLRKALDAAKAELPVKLPAWEKVIQERLAKATAVKTMQKFESLPIAEMKAKAAMMVLMQANRVMLKWAGVLLQANRVMLKWAGLIMVLLQGMQI
jgi:hypothetical protein